MSYRLDYDYTDTELEIDETISIVVYATEFELECGHSKLELEAVNFLERLDVDLAELNRDSLKEILDSEFEIK